MEKACHFILVGHSCTYQFVVSKFILARTSLLVTTSIKCGCRAARYHSASSMQMGMYSWFSVKPGYLQVWDFIVLFYTGRNITNKQTNLYTALIRRVYNLEFLRTLFLAHDFLSWADNFKSRAIFT